MYIWNVPSQLVVKILNVYILKLGGRDQVGSGENSNVTIHHVTSLNQSESFCTHTDGQMNSNSIDTLFLF